MTGLKAPTNYLTPVAASAIKVVTHWVCPINHYLHQFLYCPVVSFFFMIGEQKSAQLICPALMVVDAADAVVVVKCL